MGTSSSAYKAGDRLKLTETGETVAIWSPAPGSGCYWAHLGDLMVLIHVRRTKESVEPIVKLKEQDF